MKKKLVNQWLSEDFEWSRSNSPAGDYNRSFTPEEPGVFREDPGAYRQPVPLYQLHNNRPQTAQRYNPSHFNAGYSQSTGLPPPHRDFSPTRPMRILRPQVRTSWDV